MDRRSAESAQSDPIPHASSSTLDRILDRKAPSKSSYHMEASQRPLSICQVCASWAECTACRCSDLRPCCPCASVCP